MTSAYGGEGDVRKKSQGLDVRNQWRQYKNVENWISKAAVEAVSEHQWHNAEALLPCAAIRSQPVTPPEFLFKLIHVVLMNTHDGSSELDQYFMRNIFVLGGNHFEFSLLALVEEITAGTQEGLDSLFEVIDDLHTKYSKATKSRAHAALEEQEHWQGLVWSYKGVVLYAKWKILLKENEAQHETVETYDADSQITNISSQMLSQMSAPSCTQDSSSLAQEAYTYLNKAVERSQPCEWLLSPYLELKKDLEGEFSVLEYLQDYVNKFNDHLPAHIFAYHYLKKHIAMSEEAQRVALQGISRMSPANPLVLTYVKELLNLATHNQVEQSTLATSTEDSGLEDEDVDNASSGQENNTKERSYNPNCFLRREKVVSVLFVCIRKVKNLIEYKQWHWKLEPWQVLTNILRKIHMAWICCWSCPSCIMSRRKMTFISRRFLSLWRNTFWTTIPDSITRCVAEVLMHSAYASFIFSYSTSFVYIVMEKLQPDFPDLAEELNKFINMKGEFTTKYMDYRNRKANSFSRSGASCWNTANFSAIQGPGSSLEKENEVRSTGMFKENTEFHEIVSSAAEERLKLLEMRLTGSLQTRGKNCARRQERQGTSRSCGSTHKKTSSPGHHPVISKFTPLVSDDSLSDFQPPKKKVKGIGPGKCKNKVPRKKLKNKKQDYDNHVREESELVNSLSAEQTSVKVDVHIRGRGTVNQDSEDLVLVGKYEKSQKKVNNSAAKDLQHNSVSLLDYSRKAKERVSENELENQEILHDERKSINSIDETPTSDKDSLDHENESDEEDFQEKNDVLSNDVQEPVAVECEMNYIDNGKSSDTPSLIKESGYTAGNKIDDGHNSSSKELSDDEMVISSLAFDTSLLPKLSQYPGSRRRQSVEAPLTDRNMNSMSTGYDSQPFSSGSLQHFRADLKDFNHSTPVGKASADVVSVTPLDIPSYAELADDECEAEPEEQRCDINSSIEDHALPSSSHVSVVLPCQNLQIDSRKCDQSNQKSVLKINEAKKSGDSHRKGYLKDFDFSELPFPFRNESEDSSSREKFRKDPKSVDDCLVTLDQRLDICCEKKEKSKEKKKKNLKKNRSKPKDNFAKEICGSPIEIVTDLISSDGNGEGFSKTPAVCEYSAVIPESLFVNDNEKDQNESGIKSKTEKTGKQQELVGSKIRKRYKQDKSERKHARTEKVYLEPSKKANELEKIQIKETNHGGMVLDPLCKRKGKKKSKVKYKQEYEFGFGVASSKKKSEMFTDRKEELAECVGVTPQHREEIQRYPTKDNINVSGETKKSKTEEADAARGVIGKKNDRKDKNKVHELQKLKGDEGTSSEEGKSKNKKQKSARITQETYGCHVNTERCKEVYTMSTVTEAGNVNYELLPTKELKKNKKKKKKKCSEIYEDSISDKPVKSTNSKDRHSQGITNKEERKCSEVEALSFEKTGLSPSHCSIKNKKKSKQKALLDVGRHSSEKAENTDRALKKKKKSKLKQDGESKAKKSEYNSLAESANEKIIVLPKSKRTKEDSAPEAVTNRFWHNDDFYSDLPFPFPT